MDRPIRKAVFGAVAGAVAWRAMDGVLRFLYDHEASAVLRREDQARRRVPAMEVLAERLAGLADLTLSDEERQRGGTLMQWTVGIGAGVLYGMLRDYLPASGLRRGLLYGAGFSLLVDEGLTPSLGLAPGPFAFPWQTHARGFAGHLVYGVIVEVAMRWLTAAGGHGYRLHLSERLAEADQRQREGAPGLAR